MPSPLHNQALAALRTLRQRGERIIDSADVYQTLVAQSTTPPDGELGAVFTELAERGAIQVSHYMDATGTTRYGAMIITIVRL